MTTLADLAKQNKVSPQAVSKWRDKAIERYGDLDYQQNGKRKLYTNESVEKILEFRPEPEPESEPIETQILTGNHRVTGELAPLPQAVDLGALRAPGSELTLFSSDTLAQVDQALDVIDDVLDAMDEDTENQMANLRRTQQANNKLKRKVDQLKARSQQYSVESKVLSLMQGKESSELQESMQALQNIGNTD